MDKLQNDNRNTMVAIARYYVVIYGSNSSPRSAECGDVRLVTDRPEPIKLYTNKDLGATVVSFPRVEPYTPNQMAVFSTYEQAESVALAIKWDGQWYEVRTLGPGDDRQVNIDPSLTHWSG